MKPYFHVLVFLLAPALIERAFSADPKFNGYTCISAQSMEAGMPFWHQVMMRVNHTRQSLKKKIVYRIATEKMPLALATPVWKQEMQDLMDLHACEGVSFDKKKKLWLRQKISNCGPAIGEPSGWWYRWYSLGAL